MWHVWIRVNGQWVESAKAWVEEPEARAAAVDVKHMFPDASVFLQFGDDTPEEI